MNSILKTLLLILSVTLAGCKKSSHEVRTLDITEITATTAVLNGEINVLFSASKGFLCTLEPDEEYNGYSVLVNGADFIYDTKFFYEMTDLTPNTKYYVRAVAQDNARKGVWYYGEEKVFTTLAE
jgi:hypothetical protein